MIRIAFVGRSREDKTFLAEYLRYTYKFSRKNLNDPLVDFIKKLYYFEPDQRVHWEMRREMYDALYKINPEMWITYYKNRMERSTSDVVCDDARYMNEGIALQEMGFKMVRVTSPLKKNARLRKSLGKSAAPGTLFLNELYSRDFLKDIKVDYSIHNVERESTKRAMDAILEELRRIDN